MTIFSLLSAALIASLAIQEPTLAQGPAQEISITQPAAAPAQPVFPPHFPVLNLTTGLCGLPSHYGPAVQQFNCPDSWDCRYAFYNPPNCCYPYYTASGAYCPIICF